MSAVIQFTSFSAIFIYGALSRCSLLLLIADLDRCLTSVSSKKCGTCSITLLMQCTPTSVSNKFTHLDKCFDHISLLSSNNDIRYIKLLFLSLSFNFATSLIIISWLKTGFLHNLNTLLTQFCLSSNVLTTSYLYLLFYEIHFYYLIAIHAGSTPIDTIISFDIF